MPQKQHLPQKTCPVCGRPFAWRKKWEKVWEEVKYCSDQCRKGGAKKKFQNRFRWPNPQQRVVEIMQLILPVPPDNHLLLPPLF